MEDGSILEEIWQWIIHTGVHVVLIFIGIYFFEKFGVKIVGRLVKEGIRPDSYATPEDEKQREKTLVGIISAIYKIFVWVLGAMIILSTLGVNIGPMLAGAGIVGLAVGFGAQSLVTDFISGVFIIMENQFRVGDTVELNDEVAKGGVIGTVQSISIRTTVLRDLDGNQHYIPNGQIRLATNKSMDYSNINLNVGIAYDSDIDKCISVINKVGEEMMHDENFGQYIIEKPEFLRVNELGDSAIELKIVGKVKPGEQWQINGELRKRIKQEFDKNDIEIPFPQVVVHKSKS